MKSKSILMMILASQFGLASNLMAATSVREDTSMFLVWMFLGMCALIVIIQLMPALFLTVGMIKSVFTSDKSPAKVNASGKE